MPTVFFWQDILYDINSSKYNILINVYVECWLVQVVTCHNI